METVVFAWTGEAMAAPSFMWLDSVGRRKLLSYGLTGVTWRSARPFAFGAFFASKGESGKCTPVRILIET